MTNRMRLWATAGTMALTLALTMAGGAHAATHAKAQKPAAPAAPAKPPTPTAPAQTGTRDVIYAPAPAWVVPPPAVTGTPAPAGAAYQADYSDTQVRAANGGTETYLDYRLKILKPEALQLGNLTAAWQPDAGSVTVHTVKIIRDGAVIDVLDKTKFRVIEREQNLDQASLDGLLSAVLQVPGLQVGDTFEFAATVTSHDKTLGDYAFGLGQLPSAGTQGAYRFRVIWPQSEKLYWQTSRDLVPPPVRTVGDVNELMVELRDPAGSVPTDDAPLRYNVRRSLDFTGFSSWNELSKRMYPVFDAAAQVKPGSPVQAEIDRIKAASADPATRVQMALSLVEDRIRYVYVGLNGENYRPATVDETWERKYGDCKSKTVLLLALLHGMGIDAEAVLANSAGGDGLNEWLANPMMFDHVLVRARAGDTSWWLDGTRQGDTRLDQIPPLELRWVLPLRADGAAIEAVPATALTQPEHIQLVDIDARAGFDAPAKVRTADLYHGDAARILKMQLEAAPAADVEQGLKSMANKSGTWSQVDTATWAYDDAINVLTLTVTGTWQLDWQGKAKDGRSYNTPGGGFYPPDERHRAKEQDQSAPWVRDKFPEYNCYATTVRLPEADKGMHWYPNSEPMNRRLAGQAYWRVSGLSDGVMRTVMSSNIYMREITAADAAAVNSQIQGFDNNQSSVYEGRGKAWSSPLPFGDNAGWAELTQACSPH